MYRLFQSNRYIHDIGHPLTKGTPHRMKKVRLSTRITNRESDSFKRYLEEVREIPQLDVNEEYELALIISDTTLSESVREAAIEKLTKANLRFVISVAKQYVSAENSIEDLVDEGNIGLIQAARRFDHTLGLKFITYAVWWIRRDILGYINKNARIIRLPNNKLALLSALKKEVVSIEQHLQRTPTINDILQFTTGYDEKDVRFFLESERENSYSFDKPVQEEDSQTLMSDLFEDTTFGPTDKHLNDADSDYNISKLLSNLKNDKDRKVLTLLFGLDGNEPLSIKEVGDVMKVSRERVRQIREKSLLHLRGLVKSV